MGVIGRIVGAASVVGSVAAAATVGGITAQRMAVQRYREWGREADDDFDRVPGDRSYSVAAHDGVALHVEEVGPADAPLTVIFSHGWTLRLDSWHFQRLGLAGPGLAPTDTDDPRGGDRARLVLYDHRSHGRSSRAEPDHCTIDDLAQDLQSVIATAAPSGPVALVGHSMGGMAVMALAGRDPDLFADRVRAVALISTSADERTRGLRRLVQINGSNPLLPAAASLAGRYPRLVERGRRAGGDAVWLATRALGFADPHVPAPLVDYLDRMISATPIDVISDFAPAVLRHDVTASLPALAAVRTLVMVGGADRMTPPSRSVAIADEIPHARLVVLEGAGHVAIMERADEVNRELRGLLRPLLPTTDTSGTGLAMRGADADGGVGGTTGSDRRPESGGNR